MGQSDPDEIIPDKRKLIGLVEAAYGASFVVPDTASSAPSSPRRNGSISMSTKQHSFKVSQALSAIRRHMKLADTHLYNELMVPEYEHEDKVWDNMEMERHLLVAWRLMVECLEELGCHAAAREAQGDFSDFKKQPLKQDMGPQDHYLVWSRVLSHYVEFIRDLNPRGKAQREHEAAELCNTIESLTPYLTDRGIFGWVPAREEDIQRRLHGVLEAIYPDARSKSSLPKQGAIKSFAPDTHLPSVRTLIEYKFVPDRETAKRVVDEMLADTVGYQGGDFDTLVFVVYETTRTYTPAQWQSQLSQATPAWKSCRVVVLQGVPPTEADRRLSLGAPKVERLAKEKGPRAATNAPEAATNADAATRTDATTDASEAATRTAATTNAHEAATNAPEATTGAGGAESPDAGV